MAKKNFTIQQVLDALEYNHVPHKRGGWFSQNQGKIGAACILGQACVNLGVTNMSLSHQLNIIKPGSADKIISLNDHTKTSYQDMVKEARKIFKGYEDRVITLDTEFFHSEIGKA